MDHFELVSEYKPTGDQPQAIAELVKGFKEGRRLSSPIIRRLRHSYTVSLKNFFRIMRSNIS